MNGKMDELDKYLKFYLEINIPDKITNKDEEIFIIQSNLISTLLVEVYLIKNISDKKSALEQFRSLIRGKTDYLKDGSIIMEG